MFISDPIGDLLTRIRNGQSARLVSIHSPASKLRANVLEVCSTSHLLVGAAVSRESGTSRV